MQTKPLNVTALMTAPRMEMVLTRSYIEMAFKRAGIPLVISGGVFYGQCMQRMLEDAIADGSDVAITVDFDSLFTHKDISDLLSALASHDEVDAVAAMQVRRGKPFPLLTVAGQTELDLNGSLLKVDTAHFGLTAIDLHKLKDVPKPWFWSTPDENGEWTSDAIDDDISFWYAWKNAGLSVFIDPTLRIGHVEEMVVMMDDDMKPVHVYPHEWAEQAYKEPKRDGVLVFVGANAPTKDLVNLTKHHEKSYLFEPLPDVAQQLRHHFDGDETVEVIEAACADKSAVWRYLNRYNANGLSSSLGTMTEQACKQYSQFDLSLQDKHKVSVYQLSETISHWDIEKIKTLVIDAQGMDLTILKDMESYLREGRIEGIQAEADGDGFRHYDGLPDNSESAFAEFMSQFPWYEGDRLESRLGIQPDLVWKFNAAKFAEREVACV